MSKTGSHIALGPRTGFGLFCTSKPAVVISVDDGGALLEAKTKSNGHTITIFRDTSVYLEAPPDFNTAADMVALARAWYPALKAKWQQNPADFYTITNEIGGGDGPDVPGNLTRLVAYEREIMRLANLDGFGVCVLNHATGSPGSFETWKQISAPFIVEAWGWGNIYGRHVYGGGDLVDGSGNVLPGGPVRPFQEVDYLRSLGAVGGVVLTEVGLDGGFGYPGQGRVLAQMSGYERALRLADEFIGLCWWLLGNHQSNANWQDALTVVSKYNLDNPTPPWEWPGEPPDNPDPPPSNNLLLNASFEDTTWDDQPGGQVPHHWDLIWKTNDGYVLGESRILPRAFLPPAEHPLYYYPPPPDQTSQQTYKIFWSGLPLRPRLSHDSIDLPPGRYRYSFRIYPDIYTNIVNGVKQWSQDPNACRVRLFWNVVVGEWVSLFPYGGSGMREVSFEWEHSGGPVKPGVQIDMPLKIHNGFFTDAHNMVLVPVDPPPPPPPGTFEQRLWEASLIEQNANGVMFNPALGLWQLIKADGLDAVTHERVFEGVTYQTAEKPGGERWVYTWTPAAGFARFKWPEDEPPPPPPPPPPGPVIVDVVDQLAKHATLTYTTRPLSAVTTLTVHHTVSGGGSNPLAEVKSIAQYHVSPRPPDVPDGWPGIGYHFCIGANGAIYQVNKLTTKSYHAGSYNAPGDENYWSIGVALLGNFTNNPPPQAQQDAARALITHLKGIVPTAGTVLGHKQMPGAATQCPGNTWEQWLPYVAGGSAGVEMPPYFLPAAGDYGDICILANNWGAGDERQQLQRSGSYSYVTKNQQWERRRIAADGIYLELDTSPGDNQYYTITGTAWLPLRWNPGQEHTRTETVKFFNKGNCQPTAAPYTVTNKIKFAALHSAWVSPAGVKLNNVIELQWLIAGQVEESYWFAPGKGLVQWKNKAGKHSWVTSIVPVGQQGNNVRESGCFG